MNLIREIKQNHKVNLQGAKEHVRLTIKNYSQLEELVFHKQLDVTTKGLVVAGLSLEKSLYMIYEELGGDRYYEWINGRAIEEIITN